MGQNSAKIFNPPQSYGQANVNLASQVTPQGIAAPTVLLSDQAGGTPTFNPATPAQKKQQGQAKGQKPQNLYIGPDYQPIKDSNFF